LAARSGWWEILKISFVFPDFDEETPCEEIGEIFLTFWAVTLLWEI
jgi:hypothetical protein